VKQEVKSMFGRIEKRMRVYRANMPDQQRILARQIDAQETRIRRQNRTSKQLEHDRLRAREHMSRIRNLATLPEALRCNLDIFDPSGVHYKNDGVVCIPIGQPQQQVSLRRAVSLISEIERAGVSQRTKWNCALSGRMVEK